MCLPTPTRRKLQLPFLSPFYLPKMNICVYQKLIFAFNLSLNFVSYNLSQLWYVSYLVYILSFIYLHHNILQSMKMSTIIILQFVILWNLWFWTLQHSISLAISEFYFITCAICVIQYVYYSHSLVQGILLIFSLTIINLHHFHAMWIYYMNLFLDQWAIHTPRIRSLPSYNIFSISSLSLLLYFHFLFIYTLYFSIDVSPCWESFYLMIPQLTYILI